MSYEPNNRQEINWKNVSQMTFPVASNFNPAVDDMPEINKKNFAGAMLARFLPKMTPEYREEFKTKLAEVHGAKIDSFMKRSWDGFAAKLKKAGDITPEERQALVRAHKEDMKKVATEIFGNFGKNSDMPEAHRDAVFYAVNLAEKVLFSKREEVKAKRTMRVWNMLDEQMRMMNEPILDVVLNRGKRSEFNFKIDKQAKILALGDRLTLRLKLKLQSRNGSRDDLVIPKRMGEKLMTELKEPHQVWFAFGEIHRQIRAFVDGDIHTKNGKTVMPKWSDMVNMPKVLEDAKQCPGWRKALMHLPNDLAWHIYSLQDEKIMLSNNRDFKRALTSAGTDEEKQQVMQRFFDEGVAAMHKNNTVLMKPPFWMSGSPYQDFQRGTYESLCEKAKIDPWVQKDVHDHSRVGAFNISRLFERNMLGAEKFVMDKSGYKEITSRSLNSAGISLKMPARGWNKKEWVGLVMKHPDVADYASSFADIEKYLGRSAKSLSEAREVFGLVGYGILGEDYPEMAKVCASVEVGPKDFAQVVKHATHPKKEAFIPDPGKIQGEKFRVSLLQPGDVRALVAGDFSGCCQTIGSAGASCAIHSFKEPASGVFWIENGDGSKFMAQTWAWMSKDKKSVVLDSVESEHREPGAVATIGEAVHAIADHLNKQGLTVYMGATDYGVTGQLVRSWSNSGSLMSSGDQRHATPEMFTPCNYSDSRGGVYCLRAGPEVEIKNPLNMDSPIAVSPDDDDEMDDIGF